MEAENGLLSGALQVIGREGEARLVRSPLGAETAGSGRGASLRGRGGGGAAFSPMTLVGARGSKRTGHRALTSTLVTRWPSSAPDSRRRTVLIRSSLRLRVASASRPAPWGPLLPGDCVGLKSKAASSLSTSASFCAWTTLFPAGRVRCRDPCCEQTPRPASRGLLGRGGLRAGLASARSQVASKTAITWLGLHSALLHQPGPHAVTTHTSGPPGVLRAAAKQCPPHLPTPSSVTSKPSPGPSPPLRCKALNCFSDATGWCTHLKWSPPKEHFPCLWGAGVQGGRSSLDQVRAPRRTVRGEGPG